MNEAAILLGLIILVLIATTMWLSIGGTLMRIIDMLKALHRKVDSLTDTVNVMELERSRNDAGKNGSTRKET